MIQGTIKGVRKCIQEEQKNKTEGKEENMIMKRELKTRTEK